MGWLKNLFTRKVTSPGAVHGHRFVVIRQPLGTIEYGGHSGAKARETYETTYPNHGEIVELWDRDVCRGRKVD
jgi:hypothetical protein